MAIALRKPQEIEKLRKANIIVAETLELLREKTVINACIKELDIIAEDYIISRGALPSFKGLYGFPNAVCCSLNEVIIHGVPKNYKLRDGDIIGYDIGTKLDGWFGDAAITMPVGNISYEDEKLIACAKSTLMYAISIIKPGMRFKELSQSIEIFIRKQGFVPLKNFCGHGIGREPHEEPNIPNYFEGTNSKQGPKIKNGMVFSLEPMICQKEEEPKILDNKWDVVSIDGLNGSHYEHTVAIINNKAEILSVVQKG